jgi:hypothetical protein
MTDILVDNRESRLEPDRCIGIGSSLDIRGCQFGALVTLLELLLGERATRSGQ